MTVTFDDLLDTMVDIVKKSKVRANEEKLYTVGQYVIAVECIDNVCYSAYDIVIRKITVDNVETIAHILLAYWNEDSEFTLTKVNIHHFKGLLKFMEEYLPHLRTESNK